MSVVVIVELTSRAPWQSELEAAYGPFPTANSSEVSELRRMAKANHGACGVTVLPLRPMPEIREAVDHG